MEGRSMSKNKKPRKKYDPTKRARTDAFGGIRALFHARAVQSTEQLDATQIRDLGIGYHGALHSITSGTGCYDDANTLAMAANIAMLLCEVGVGREYIAQAKAGQEAVVLLMMRARTHGKFVATGSELRALQDLLELHDAQLESEDCTEGKLTQVLDECKRRIRQGHTLEVAA